jgi:hypothetical protein
MEEITGVLVDVEREDPRANIMWVIILVGEKEETFMGDARMIANVIATGRLSKGDEIFAEVDGGFLYSFGHVE